MKRRISLLLAVIMVLSALLAGCGGKTTDQAAETTTPAAEGTSAATVNTTGSTNDAPAVVDEDRVLNLSSIEAFQTMDPNLTNSVRSKLVWYQIYEGLIYYDHEAQEVVPRVAESWESSADGLTITFKLRDGVKFHNGDAVTADDVVYSINRCKEGSVYANHVAAIESITKIDDSHVEIKLGYAYAPFWQYLSELYIMSESFVAGLGGDLSVSACGTGPYKVDSVDLAVGIEVSAFEDYYGDAPAIKKVKWSIITDSASAAMALQSGDLDYLELAWSQVAQLEADSNIEIGAMPSLHTSYLAFNCSKAPFDDVRVRQAIAYLINVDDIVLAAFEGYGEADTFIMHPDLAGMPDNAALETYQYEYNPEKGLALLQEAGYDTSKEIDLGAILTLPESHYLFKPAQVIQSELAEYNIKVEITPYESGTMFASFFGGDYTMAVCGGSYGADASGYATVHGSSAMGEIGGCASYLYNDELDALFAEGVTEMDPEKRGEIYGEIMKILYETCPQVGVGHKQVMVGWRNDVHVSLRLDYPLISEWYFTE